MSTNDVVGLISVVLIGAGAALIYAPAALLLLGALGLVWVALGDREANA